ncbi:hypothetical protein AB1Y20_022062 [Prymnesium parvum]|uniref:Uncharacterized protein n=1 Tax=Prymnesium parvum TaxID=97485 RepID=A0AB34JGT4_PRYPA
MASPATSLQGDVLDPARLRSSELVHRHMTSSAPAFLAKRKQQAEKSKVEIFNSIPESVLAAVASSREEPCSSDDSDAEETKVAQKRAAHWAPKVRRRGVPETAAPSAGLKISRSIQKKPMAGIPMTRSLSHGSDSGKRSGVTRRAACPGVVLRKTKSTPDGDEAVLAGLPLQRSAMSDLAATAASTWDI